LLQPVAQTLLSVLAFFTHSPLKGEQEGVSILKLCISHHHSFSLILNFKSNYFIFHKIIRFNSSITHKPNTKAMKLSFAVIFALILLAGTAYSQQKIGYVDSKVILETLQDARDAQTNLDNLVQKWKLELQAINDSLVIMKDDYDKKKLILTEKIKTQMESDIKLQEQKLTDFKQNKFGENGEYFQKQTELMKPVQDRVFKAIQDVAKEGGYDFVIDRSTQLMLLYMNDRYDLTQKVIKNLEAQ